MHGTGMAMGMIFFTAMALFGGLPTTVRAQQPTGQSPTVVMGEVVVTASRQAEEVTRIPAHVTVIDADTIQKSNARNVPEVLSTFGVHVNDVAGNKRNYSIDLRGFGESAPANLLVMVDGRRINQADLSGTDWALIPLERIDRIEVIRGSRGSVLYGDNATGGVINLITKEGLANEAMIGLHYGSYDTFNGLAGVSGATGILSYDMTGSFLKSDGYRDNSDTEAKDIGATLRADPSNALRLNLSGGYHKDETGMPGALLQSDLDAGIKRTATKNPDNFADTEDYYVKGGGELFFLTEDVFRLDATYRKRSVSQFANFLGGGSFRGDADIETVTVSPQLMFQESFDQVSNRLILGMDFTEAKEDIENNFGDSSRLEKENWGYYIHDELGVTRSLSFSGGYRYDRAVFRLNTSGFDFMGNPYRDNAKRTMTEEVYTLGVNYLIGKTKFYLTHGTGFRYPLLDEFFNYSDFQFNSDLKAQTSRNWEAGTEIRIGEYLMLNANFFHIMTKDEIFLDPVSYANINLDGDTKRQGVEARLTYRGSGVLADVSYTYTHAKIDNGAFSGSRVPDVPEHMIGANVSYLFDFGLLLGVNGIYVGSRPFISDFSNTYDHQESYTVINAKIEYSWNWFIFFLNLNNIFDETYSSYGVLGGFPTQRAYYPSPEFNIFAGVTMRIGNW